MTEEKWQDIKAMVEEKFEVIDKRLEEKKIGKDKQGNEVEEKKETIEFKGPLGKIKLERVIRPKVLEERTQYSRRVGGDIQVNYIYSSDEFIDLLRAYQWNIKKEEWEEIKPDIFG